MTTRSTTAEQHDANRRYVIHLVQALAKDKKDAPEREPWTPAHVSRVDIVEGGRLTRLGKPLDFVDSAGIQPRSNTRCNR